MKTYTLLVIASLLCFNAFTQYTEKQKVVTPDGMPIDWFGTAVAFSGDGNTMIVGARYDDVDNTKDCGSAYIYTRNNKQWQFSARLNAAGKIFNGRFGSSVALSGDGTAAVIGTSNSNVIYYFKKENGAWIQQYRVPPPYNDVVSKQFGIAVAISYDGKTVMASDAGNARVSIFQQSNNNWHYIETIQPSDRTDNSFGLDIALSRDGSTALIGAPNDFSGAAYVFERINNTWKQAFKIKPLDTLAANGWGSSLDLSLNGKTAIITHTVNSSPKPDYKPAPIIFRKTNNGWQQQARLIADSIDRFEDPEGVALSASGNTAVYSVPSKKIGLKERQGELYVFTYKNNTWVQIQSLVYSQGNVNGDLGIALAFTPDERTIAAGSDDYLSLGTYGPGYVITFEVADEPFVQNTPPIATNENIIDPKKTFYTFKIALE